MAGRQLLLALALCLLASSIDARPKILPKLGPCSTTVAHTLYFSSVSELFARKQFPKTQTVLMYMKNNITLSGPVYLDQGFSCTIFKADPALGSMPFFVYPSNDNHTMVMINVTNAMFIGIGWHHDWTYLQMWQCHPKGAPAYYRPFWFPNSEGYWDNEWTCAGLVVYRCFNVQITQASVSGRLDLIRSGSVEVSYSNLYSDSDFWQSVNGTNMAAGYGWSWGTIRIMLCGDPVNLVRANNRIVNNYIRGSSTTVFLYWGAVGNIVQNNYITGFGFSGIQCGQGMQNVADCMLNTIELNYIENDPSLLNQIGENVTIDPDGAGIYYDLHWVNPGNRDSCNYIINVPVRCYYIDYATSGLLIEGGVCSMNGGYNGASSTGNIGGDYLKLNTGKFNVIKSGVWAHNGKLAQLGWLSCQNWCINRCGPGTDQTQGNAWWNGFLKSYNNPMWNTNYPYLSTLCTALGYTVNGVYYPCDPKISTVPNPGLPLPYCYLNMTQTAPNGTFFSPSADVSGNCSGWPTGNDLGGIIFVSNFTVTKTSSWYYNLYQMTIQGDCAPVGDFVPKTNNVPTYTKKWLPGSLGFNDEAGGDYGADDPSAPIYQSYPDFYSCPRRLVGPQTASFAQSRAKDALYSKFSKFRQRWIDEKPNPYVANQKPNLREWAKKLSGFKKRFGTGEN